MRGDTQAQRPDDERGYGRGNGVCEGGAVTKFNAQSRNTDAEICEDEGGEEREVTGEAG